MIYALLTEFVNKSSVYLTIILRERAGYEIIDNQRAAYA